MRYPHFPSLTAHACRTVLACILLIAALSTGPLSKASTLSTHVVGFDTVLGLTATQQATDYTIEETSCSAPANVFWPGDSPSFTFQIHNKTTAEIKANAHFDLISIGTRSLDWWTVSAFKVADIGRSPIAIDLPASGWQDITIAPAIPARFGAYALVLDVDGHGRDFAATCLRTPAATAKPSQFPTFAMDLGSPAALPLFQRLGIKGVRQEFNYFPTDSPDYEKQMSAIDAQMKLYTSYGIAVMLTMEPHNPSPDNLQFRSFLDDKAQGTMGYPGDAAMMPSADPDFRKYMADLCGRFGWPKGPINAVELWNEPWEGSSISGWGADLPRYREIYTAMAEGVVDARASAGTQVLIGGACSSMNTEDKLFPDGKDTFLKWLDFTSIHYQPMATEPTINPMYANRKSPYGPVRAWDTESWMANSEDRVAGVIAGLRATGLTRTNGVSHDYARVFEDVQPHAAGAARITLVQPLPTSGGIAAVQAYIGDRPFKQLLFQNGLPWVIQFDGVDNPDDGTLVVVGDLGGVFDRDSLLYRQVSGETMLKDAAKLATLKTQLAALPATATADDKASLQRSIDAITTLHDASMTLADPGRKFLLYDQFGNPTRSRGKLVVPLNGLGYYVRTDGSRGSFAALIAAVRAARVDGYEPVSIVAHDLLARIDQHPALGVTITNILNRSVSGPVSVKLGDLNLDSATQTVALAGGETKSLTFTVASGAANDSNTYPLSITFDGGANGMATHEEDMHVNVIAHKTITVDGNLDDWAGVLPQPFHSDGSAGPNETQKAWLPFVKFDDTVGPGVSTVYLAYDEHNFYYAAKISDNTPYDGNIRFANRDDDSYFYPDTFYVVQKDKDGNVTKSTPMQWPAGVRHYSYRKNPDIPSGGGTDGVQVAFNVLPDSQKRLLMNPPGTPSKFMMYPTTDYEYAFNPIAAQYGGGTEMWRLLAPGVPYKHFYPRQPKADVDGGPVAGGQLVMRRDGNTRIVEAAIPWTEIPDVKARLDSGSTIKFSCRINDNKGPTYEMANNRSVSKKSIYTFHDAWTTAWSNELEFAFDK